MQANPSLRQQESRQKSILVFGGARSGKTAFALGLAEASLKAPIMLATARVEDDEMAAKVAAHRLERGPHWSLIEEPLALVPALRQASAADRIVVVDCLTLWLSNVMFAQRDLTAEGAALAACLPELAGPVIFVSNELGLGTVPSHALTRKFRNAQGRLNQQMAAAAEEVIFVQAGLPRRLKPFAPLNIIW